MDTLLQFEQGVIEAERAFDPTIKPHPAKYYDLELMITVPHIHLVVAEFDGAPIGCGYARIQDSKLFLTPPQHSYLGFMYVLPEYRGNGVNNIIIQALKDWSAQKGITELQLEVYYHNDAAIKAYEKAGFSRSLIQMRMEL
ncbi:GNAT family N-acetyltransferase [Mucilaginibacter pedocola]|uniref:Acetyltransferase n=1 Tax=Mucilaginibacter pedocola TaxID=1792845 RepID=A0A1S9PF75_9SPHI|nr:GNAT family N-acetyltransferase [Mucilaginibacter pedocola]OOQ59248.1 acetyltransferase [Mucilaginibacter pedocola]